MKKEYLIGGAVILVLIIGLVWYMGVRSPAGSIEITDIQIGDYKYEDASSSGSASSLSFYDDGKIDAKISLAITSQKEGVYYTLKGGMMYYIDQFRGGILNKGDNKINFVLSLSNINQASSITLCFSREPNVEASSKKICKIVEIAKPDINFEVTPDPVILKLIKSQPLADPSVSVRIKNIGKVMLSLELYLPSYSPNSPFPYGKDLPVFTSDQPPSTFNLQPGESREIKIGVFGNQGVGEYRTEGYFHTPPYLNPTYKKSFGIITQVVE